MLLNQIRQQRRISKLAIIKEKQGSMAYEDGVNKLRSEWSIEGTL